MKMEGSSQYKKERKNILINIWMILRVPIILGILIGFFYLPVIPQPKIPDMGLLNIFNLFLFVLGVIIIIHSATILIKNAKFSPSSEIKIDPTPQNLVITGLYKYSRHPIYSGCILVYLSYCLLFRALFCILILNPLFIIFLYLKSRQEEKDLNKVFGIIYTNYQKKTSMFFPKIKKKVE